MITTEQLQKIFGQTTHQFDKFIPALTETMRHYDISTVNRRAAFIAQVGYESAYFHAVSENLNYSADALLRVFGKYFTKDNVGLYARKPESIANRVYANRMGNGDESSGDGWRYRGRGLIQLTGKNNYTAFAKDQNILLSDAVVYLGTTEGAVQSAGWFWNTNKLNVYADKNDIITITKRINGGTHGLDKRTQYYEAAKKVLQ